MIEEDSEEDNEDSASNISSIVKIGKNKLPMI